MGTPPTPPPPPAEEPAKIKVEVWDRLPPDYKEEEKLRAAGRKESGERVSWFTAFWMVLPRVAGGILEQILGIINFLLAKFGKIVARAQAEDTPGFYELLATVIWDLTGVEVNAEDLRTAVFKRGRLAGMDRIGTEVFNLLAHEFVTPAGAGAGTSPDVTSGQGIGGLPKGTLSPEQGLDAVQRFLGFLMSFSIREGNMAFFGEMASLGLIESYGAYSKELANNLSLGRQARAALRPLIDILAATPCEWALNKEYRPRRLTESTAVRAFLRGAMNAEQLREELAQQGYSDERINSVLKANLLSLTDTDIDRLLRYEIWTKEQGVQHLRERGFSKEVAEAMLLANELAQADTRIRERADFWEKQAVEGFISEAEFASIIDDFPFHRKEIQARMDLVAVKRRFPSRQLTLAQMQTAYIEGVINLREWEAYLKQEHYSEDDAKVLTLLLLTKSAEVEERARQKAERDAERDARQKSEAGGP